MQHTVSRETVFKDPSAPFFNVIDEMDQDMKKVSSFRPRQVQVDFHSGQTCFHSHLPNGQGIKQVICREINH